MAKRIKLASDQRPFVMAYWDFIESDLFDWNEKRIFIILKKFVNSNNQCFPSIETLCRLSQLSKATVLKTLKSLEEKKAIKVEHRKDKNNKTISNFYTIYDYQELWNAESIEQIKETIDIEELQLFELAKKKGYVLTKEKELDNVAPTKATTKPSTLKSKNKLPKENNTKEKEKSQEKIKNEISLDEIKEIYKYDKLIQEKLEKKQDIDSVINIIHTTMNADKAIRISGRFTKADIVKEKLKKLTPQHILYVIEKFREQTKEIKNPTAYLVTMLYHAPEQYNLDKINQEAQKNTMEQKPQEKRKSTNKFCNFEQHSYSKEDMDLIERALLRNSENITRKNDRIEPYTDTW